MDDDQQAKIDQYVAKMLENGVPPYVPEPGGKSLLAGVWSSFCTSAPTKIEKLCQPVRLETLAWLGTILACASGIAVGDAMQAMIDAIPDGEEAVLDGGDHFIFAFDIAAMRLGLDPFAMSLRPARLNS